MLMLQERRLRLFFFFFQAEDGIRYLTVTGVQTCALPISTKYRVEGQIRSPIAGLITHCTLYNGDRVKKGEIVAKIRTKESQASISGAEQQIGRASCRERV